MRLDIQCAGAGAHSISLALNITRYYDGCMRHRRLAFTRAIAPAGVAVTALLFLVGGSACTAPDERPASDPSASATDVASRPPRSPKPRPTDLGATPGSGPTTAGSAGDGTGGGSGAGGGSGSGSSVTTRIVFVRVGQGDAIVIESGSWTGLVDGGPPGAEDKVEAVLRRLDTKHLDALVVSHPHQDHIGGLPEIVDDYPPKLALLPPRTGSSAYGPLKREIRSAGSRIVAARRGQSFRFGAVRAKVLSPARPGGDENESSVVLLLTVAGRRILLTGDVTGAAEARVGDIVERGPPLFLLKVAHHGSRSSTSAAFLDDVDPRFAVICVGANSYGHPTPETIARLRAEGTRVYSTRKNGTITVTIRPSGRATWNFSARREPVTRGGGPG